MHLRDILARQSQVVPQVATIAEQEAHREHRVELGSFVDLLDFVEGKLYSQRIGHCLDMLDCLDTDDGEDVCILVH